MFTFELDTESLFEERARQFVDAWGIPKPIVTRTRSRIREAWSEGPGGWTPEWAREAERAEAGGDRLLAALCWGAAKFPAVATPARAEAYRRQLAVYEEAAPTFGVSFERRRLTVEGPAGPTDVTAHVFRRRHRPRRGLIALCGGVDTWKIELHRPAVRLARATGFTVVALDNPGTGETCAPITPDADRILASTLAALTSAAGGGPVGMIGVSFAGLWAAKLAFDGHVDAAIDLGGPVGAELIPDVRALPGGMPGILGHAARAAKLPTSEEFRHLVASLSLREQGYFARDPRAPVLAVNGDTDQFIPLADTTVFAGRPGCEAWVVRDATHCAAEKLTTVMPAAVAWMVARMTERPLDRAASALLKPIARPALHRVVPSSTPVPAR